MSTNKKFRIQNGVDVVGELSINDVTVIGADGKIVAGAIQEAVAELTAADIADLQAQVTAILGTSPETLDTLQEIVTAFQDADTNLVASVASNSSDIATINDTLTNGVATPADVAANTAAIAAANARTSGISTSSGSSNIQMTADLDMGGNKVLFSNMYSTEADLPSASDNHGMFAHVHATGAGYFAHAGAWVKLANDGSVATNISDETAARIAGDAANSAEVTAAISTAAADATSKADAAQADAEATASADATSKADAAQAAAEATASADATSKVNAAIATASADATSKANAAETAAKAHADQVVAATVDAAPAALDTLNELAAALGDDANFASTVTASIATKADDAATTAALATKEDKTVVAALDTFVKGEAAGPTGPELGFNPEVNVSRVSTSTEVFDIPPLEIGKTYEYSFVVSTGEGVIGGNTYPPVRADGSWQIALSLDVVETDTIPDVPAFNAGYKVAYLQSGVSGTNVQTQSASKRFTATTTDYSFYAYPGYENWDMFIHSISLREYVEQSDLETAASTVVPAINELHTEINTLSSTQSSDQSSLQAQINSEVIRATAAEAANAANIVSETSARTSADNALESDIISLQNQVGTIIQGSPASLDTLVEIVSAFETADASLSGVITANGTRLTTAENNITALQTDLDAEETARGAGDASLQSQINALTGTTDSDTSSLQSQLTAEVARATAAEVVNASAISTETSRATAAESGLSSDISTETAARIAADDAETSARTTADAALQSAIDAEVARATGAESGLQSAIDFVKQNTDPAALDSLTEIVAAFQNADSNISGVVSSNTTRIGALESGLTVVEGYTTDNISEGSVNKYWTEQRTKDCLTGGLCISYNSSTGEIAIDEAEVATSLKTAESFASDDADKLDGQQGTYYRINVYDVNGSLVN